MPEITTRTRGNLLIAANCLCGLLIAVSSATLAGFPILLDGLLYLASVIVVIVTVVVGVRALIAHGLANRHFRGSAILVLSLWVAVAGLVGADTFFSVRFELSQASLEELADKAPERKIPCTEKPDGLATTQARFFTVACTQRLASGEVEIFVYSIDSPWQWILSRTVDTHPQLAGSRLDDHWSIRTDDSPESGFLPSRRTRG